MVTELNFKKFAKYVQRKICKVCALCSAVSLKTPILGFNSNHKDTLYD